MRRSRERVVCNSDICLSEAPAEAEEIVCVTESVISIVCKKHQLRPKKQLFVTESVISMKQELTVKKQLSVQHITQYSATRWQHSGT